MELSTIMAGVGVLVHIAGVQVGHKTVEGSQKSGTVECFVDVLPK